MLLAVFLSGCGGGGDGDAGFDASPFYGSWLSENNNYCGSNAAEGTDGANYSATERVGHFSATEYEFTLDLYQGLTCTTKVGTLTYAAAISYSPAHIAGKPMAVRLTIDSNTRKVATLSDGTPIPLRTRTGVQTTNKTVLAIENNVLYLGDLSSTAVLDADGYPTTVLRYGPKQ